LILLVLYCQMHRVPILRVHLVVLFVSMHLRNYMVFYRHLKKYTFLYI
jgi:hypothetical protein